METVLLATLATAATPRELDRVLAEAPPEVVIVGNSKVSTDLDLDLLRSRLPTLPATTPLGVFGSKGPVWYAVLRHRVWGAGYRPKTVFVYGPLLNALPARMGAAELAGLVPWLADEEDAALTRWFGGHWDGTLRDVWTPSGGGCAGPRTELPPAPEAPGDLVADSALAAILRGAAAHGARVVFAPHPVAASSPLAELPAPDVEDRELALLRDAGAGWLDLRPAFRDEAFYGDGTHMGEAGRRALTEQLAVALRGGFDTLGPPPVPVRTVATVRGDLDLRLEAAGDCELRAALPAGWERLDDDVLGAMGLGATAPIHLTLRGKTIDHRQPEACAAGWWVDGGVLHVKGRAPPAAFAATLGEGLDEDGRRAWWIGPGVGLRLVGATAATLHAPRRTRVEVDGAARAVSGRRVLRLDGDAELTAADWVAVRIDPLPRDVDLRRGRWSFGPAPAVRVDGRAGGHRPGTVRLDVASDIPNDADVFRAAGVGACSPLQVADDTLSGLMLGRSLHVSRRDCSALDPDAPVELRLAEDRRCRDGLARWLYPGDTAVVEATAALGARRQALVLAGGVPGDATGSLQVDVRIDRVTTSTTLPLADLRVSARTLPVTGDGPVRIELRSTGWLLLTRLALVEVP